MLSSPKIINLEPKIFIFRVAETFLRYSVGSTFNMPGMPNPKLTRVKLVRIHASNVRLAKLRLCCFARL